MKQLLALAFIIITKMAVAQTTPVFYTGTMRSVMWKGELFGKIQLDTIREREHLYGVGPVEGLKGELMAVDGKIFQSTVRQDGEPKVDSVIKAAAPFFVYSRAKQWQLIPLPDSVTNMRQLENFLFEAASLQDIQQAFAVQLTGTVKQAVIHIQNLPAGQKVKQPEDARIGQQKYSVKEETVTIVGFFSTVHQGIFVHHDSYLHLHLLTASHRLMGHLEEMSFAPGALQCLIPVR